ncbi:MAG: peptidoglycan-binding domain-containing protein, partial [Anaerovoracaceae bacterium]
RNNDGWHCYETQMKGLIKCLWTCRLKKGYSGTFPVLPDRGYFRTGDEGLQVKRLQKLLNWAIDSELKADGEYLEKTAAAVKKLEKQFGFKVNGNFGKDCLKKCRKLKK